MNWNQQKTKNRQCQFLQFDVGFLRLNLQHLFFIKTMVELMLTKIHWNQQQKRKIDNVSSFSLMSARNQVSRQSASDFLFFNWQHLFFLQCLETILVHQSRKWLSWCWQKYIEINKKRKIDNVSSFSLMSAFYFLLIWNICFPFINVSRAYRYIKKWLSWCWQK